MTLSTKVIHLRYCRIEAFEEPIVVTHDQTTYELRFSDPDYRKGTGLTIRRTDGNAPSTEILLWLSIFVGEDMLDPFQEVDTRFVCHRGVFRLQKSELEMFLLAAERARKRRWPQWRRELFDDALTHFTASVRLGINLMPLNLGLFAVSLECLGNVRYGKRDKHYTFGDRHFLRYLTARLVRLKRDPNKKVRARALERRIGKDIDLLNHLRNLFYGHSLLHLQKDRVRCEELLRDWYVRYGADRPFADLSFRRNRLRDDIQREAFGLYKLGLRLNRLFIFLALGFSRAIPFASHDWLLLGDQKDDEETEFRGVKTRVDRARTIPGGERV